MCLDNSKGNARPVAMSRLFTGESWINLHGQSRMSGSQEQCDQGFLRKLFAYQLRVPEFICLNYMYLGYCHESIPWPFQRPKSQSFEYRSTLMSVAMQRCFRGYWKMRKLHPFARSYSPGLRVAASTCNHCTIRGTQRPRVLSDLAISEVMPEGRSHLMEPKNWRSNNPRSVRSTL